MVSFPYSVLFPSRGSMWHPQMIPIRFLVLSCYYLHRHYGRTSLPLFVYVLGVVVSDFWFRTIHHMQRSEFWVIFLYLLGYFYYSNSAFPSTVHSRPTLGVTSHETSWFCFHHHPLRRSCWAICVSWLCVFLVQTLIWMLQTSLGCFCGFIFTLSYVENGSCVYNWRIVPIMRVFNTRCAHFDLREHPKSIICQLTCCVIWIAFQFSLQWWISLSPYYIVDPDDVILQRWYFFDIFFYFLVFDHDHDWVLFVCSG